MSVLAKRSSTPAATLKHYVREGLIEVLTLPVKAKSGATVHIR